MTVKRAYEYAAGWRGKGELASYIPELSKADPDKLAVAVMTAQGAVYKEGDITQRFTLQSVVKVILLALGLRNAGFEQVFSRVGMEPTGDPYNSIVRLETMDHNKPLNPMINAGAIAVTSCIWGRTVDHRFNTLLEYSRKLLNNPALDYDEKTFQSEQECGDRNRALAYMLRSMGVLKGNVAEHLEVYFKACSIQASCEEISHLGAVLANGGISPVTGEQLIHPFHVKIICSIMTTCGMYDASGEYALRVGIPSKSGVGGGIVGAAPGRLGIGVYSPRLDEKGNSCCGVKAMEYLSRHLHLSIFSGVDI